MAGCSDGKADPSRRRPVPPDSDRPFLTGVLQQMTSDDMEEREQAQREAREIMTRERIRLLQQAIADSEVRGEVPGAPREEVERRLQDLLKESCVYQILMGR